MLFLILAACASPVAPVIPDPVKVITRAPTSLHYPHTAFASLDSSRNTILHTDDYLFAAGPPGANAVLDPVFGVGQSIKTFRALVYGDRLGLTDATRILDVTLYRFGMGPCPATGDISYYCPVTGVNLILGYDGWRDPDGWQTVEAHTTALVEAGYTYRIFANLSGVHFRLCWLEIELSDPPLLSMR